MPRSLRIIVPVAAIILVGLLLWFTALPVEDLPPAAPPMISATPDAPPPKANPPTPTKRVEAPRPAWPKDAPRELFGAVTDPDGAPVPGTTVRLFLRDALPKRGTSGPDGRFRLDRVPPTAERLEFSARGYETRTFDKPHFPAAPKIRWDVTLDPAEGVHGSVRCGGNPGAGAFVMLESREVLGIVKRPRAHTIADGEGRFTLPLDQAGDFRLKAVHGQCGDGTVDIDGPGEVTIVLDAGGMVAGRVIDEHEDPVESFQISATPLARGMGGPGAQAFSDPDGHFLLGPVAPGRHKVWAVAEGYQPAEARNIEVKAAETSKELVFRLKKSLILTGRITDATTGDPIAGAEVLPAEWRAGVLAETVAAYADDDGRYRLQALPGDRTSIQVRADGYRPMLGGGVEGKAGNEVVRNFALSPQPRDQVPASELTGVGAVLQAEAGGVKVRSVLDGGPASEVLQAGDVIVMVDGDDVTQTDMMAVVQAIRGEIGTDVELWVRRNGAEEPERVVITRERVVMPDRNHRRRQNRPNH